ncbi:MAG: 3'-5' exonuclease, partial [Propionicimonas sp.]|nr:3'-5' exonuclease [Propionicimonas sp.]
ALFAGVELGEGIGVPEVTAVHTERRLVGDHVPAAVRLRCLTPHDPLPAAEARRRINADLVAEVVRLLSSGIRVVDPAGERPLAAADIAVLVSSNRRGAAIAEALSRADVPAAFTGADSVFASRAAQGWLTLLRALQDPGRQTIRAAILTDFVGGDLARMASAGDDQVAEWGATLQNWSRILDRSGVAALFAAVQSETTAETTMMARVLGRDGGARDLTDYRHLAELLHAQHSAGVRGQALVAWLTEAIATSDLGGDRTRRLETDRHAVQVLTVHKAKGLQFPVVLVPQAAELWTGPDEGKPLVFSTAGERMLDLGGSGAPGRPARYEVAEQENAADRLRALYVAATRAQSQLTLWWARTKVNTETSPLHRLLFRDRDTGGVPEPGYPTDTDPGSLRWLDQAGIAVEDCATSGSVRLADGGGQGSPELVAPAWHRAIDQLWTRTSYSGLTQAVHEHPPTGLTAAAILDDEPTGTLAEAAADGPPSPMAALPGGTGFGSLVHEVLEHLDWDTPEPDDPAVLGERVRAATAAGLARFPVEGVDVTALATGILPSLLTPLGRLTDGLALHQIPVRDRLSELDFEFPLGRATTTTSLAEVAALVRRHLPAGDPLADYPEALAHPALTGQVLRGFLTGSIDSVLRIHTGSGPRFVVIDYKTNRISPDADLRLAHFTAAAMTQEMIRTHYPLQAILYCVALHRFLTERLPGYQPSRHLGGVGYLFVRGMAGPGVPEPQTGVFSWFPPAALVTDLSDLLADRGHDDRP